MTPPSDRSLAIVATATRVFRRDGFHAVTSSQIADTLSIPTGEIARLFGDKRGLYVACLQRYATGTCSAVAERLRDVPPVDGIRDALTQVAVLRGDDRRNGCMMLSAVAELSDIDPGVTAIVTRAHDEIGKLFTGAIERGQESGDVTATAPANSLAGQLVATFFSLRLLSNSAVDTDELNDLVTVAIDRLRPAA